MEAEFMHRPAVSLQHCVHMPTVAVQHSDGSHLTCNCEEGVRGPFVHAPNATVKQFSRIFVRIRLQRFETD